MVEWNVSAKGTPALVSRTPDGFSGTMQMERTIISSPRPFVLVSERELSVLRRGLTKDGWKRSLYLQDAGKQNEKYVGAGILSVANRWLDADIRIPERGGLYHDFYCDCGSRLTVPDDLQRRDEYACPLCSAKYSGEKYDAAVRLIHHNQLAGAALTLALVYGIEKDKAYADKAAELLRKYSEAYPEPHAQPLSGGMMCQSIDEAAWAIPLAQAYDLIYYSRSLSDDDKHLIENKFFRQVAQGLKEADMSGHWGSWHMSAVGVIGITIKDVSLVQFALNILRSQIADTLCDDGLWPESVHAYHFSPLAAFVFFAEACFRAGIDLYNWEVRPGKSLKAMFLAPLQYMYPSFQLPAINDGWWQSWLPIDLYEIAHRRWEDSAFAWVLKKGYKYAELPVNSAQAGTPEHFSRTSFYAFLFGRDLPGRFAAPLIRSSDFPDYGLCNMRSADDMMVTLDYGHSMSNGHLDKMGFTVYANNYVAVPDYGTAGYGAKILDWQRSTAAHNTVVVDGQSQQPAKERSLTGRYSGLFSQFAEAVATDIYPGVRHTRKIILIGSACIISDTLESDQEHDYDWLIRCEGKPEVKGKYQPADIDPKCYPLFNFDHVNRFDNCYRLDWKSESGALAFAMWNDSNDGCIGLGACPTETMNRKASLLMCRKHGRNVRFLAALVPTTEDREINFDKNSSIIEIHAPEKTEVIYLKGYGEDSSAHLQTDGDFAAVRVVNDVVVAVALMRGSKVEWKGDVLLECPSPVECIEVSFEERSPAIRYGGGEVGIIKLRTHARAMRINGHRVAATNTNGHALLRVTPQLLAAETGFRS